MQRQTAVPQPCSHLQLLLLVYYGSLRLQVVHIRRVQASLHSPSADLREPIGSESVTSQSLMDRSRSSLRNIADTLIGLHEIFRVHLQREFRGVILDDARCYLSQYEVDTNPKVI